MGYSRIRGTGNAHAQNPADCLQMIKKAGNKLSVLKKCNSIIHFGQASKLMSSYIERFPNKIHTYFKSRFIKKSQRTSYRRYHLR